MNMQSAEQLLHLGQRARADGRLDDAERCFTAAVELARTNGEKTTLVDALKGVGRTERDRGRLDLALESYEEAAAICKSEGLVLPHAHTLRHVGDILAQQGRGDAARERCEAALRIYRDHGAGPPLDVANALRSCALLAEEFDGSEAAMPLWKEARSLYASVGVQAGVEECDSHLVGS